ncbi:MAG: DUF2147 domain-containing protein, partial [Bacteroidales bacterium]|nr:DUF2147 domain-containing protein [Bacteroidales bacterium]
MKLIFLSIISALLFVSGPNSKPIEGQWKTIDDETGKPKSVVQIYKKSDGKLYGKIIKLYRSPNEDQNPSCNECTDYRKGKKIIGMEIITGLKKDGDEWYADDAILDPANGKIYDCKIWLDSENPNKLYVRGYISFLYRTQT